MLKTTIDQTAGASPWRRLGDVKCGFKDAAGLPKELPYFGIPDAYKPKLGEKPMELKIMLANPLLTQNFDTRAAVYQANKAKWCHTADDVKAKRFLPTGEKKSGKDVYAYREIACPAAACEFRQSGKCKPRGFFDFMIPAAGEIGVFSLRVSSSVSIAGIYAVLKSVEALCRNRPRGMFGIPMTLRREARQFSRDLNGSGQPSQVTKYIVTLEFDYRELMASDQQLLAPDVDHAFLLNPAPAPGAPVPHDVDLGEEPEEEVFPEFPDLDPNTGKAKP